MSIPGGSEQAQGRAPSAWNIANYLTVLRILLVPVFGVLLMFADGGIPAYRYGAAAVFVLATLTDSLDGDLARRRNLVTDFGKVSDPIADKALIGMGLVGLSLLAEVPWWVTVLILAREVGVTVMRFVVIRHGVMAASRGGKVKTILQSFAVGLLVLPLWTFPDADLLHRAAMGLLYVSLIVSLVTGIDYLGRAQRLKRTSARTLARKANRQAVRDARRGGS